MIERLISTIRQLSVLSPAELEAETSEKLRGDCADAVRLELDCPQQSLTPPQRAALSRLSDALEAGSPPVALLAAARSAGAAIGVAVPAPAADPPIQPHRTPPHS